MTNRSNITIFYRIFTNDIDLRVVASILKLYDSYVFFLNLTTTFNNKKKLMFEKKRVKQNREKINKHIFNILSLTLSS